MALEGAIEANFSVLTKQAKITIDINKVSIRKVLDVINVGKFTAELKGKRGKVDIRDTIQKESKDKKSRLLYSLVLWIPILFLIWIIPNVYPLNKFTLILAQPNGPTLYVYITAVLSLGMQLYLGLPLYVSAWVALKSYSSNMDTLVVIGTSASILYGIILFVMGYGSDMEDEMSYQMKITEHAHSFEVSSTILFIICIGKYLEAYAKSRTVQKLSDLASIKVTKATLFVPNNEAAIDFNGEERVIPVELLNKNDYIKVINGQIIPTDATVVYGQGHCNESMLTGESRLAKKEIKSKVFGGTLLEKGSLILRVDVIEEESSLNQILKLVENAQTSKAPIQAYADKISSYFVPVIIICAITAWVIWFVAVYTSQDYFSYLRESKFSFAFTFGISTVVIACPCALGLATPTAVMVGSGVAANLGILIKGGKVLEKASKITAVVFDKTGTLTEGVPEVTDSVNYAEDLPVEDIYFLTGKCESESEHPLGKVIAKEFLGKLSDEEVDQISQKYMLVDFENFNGEGIVCQVKGDLDNKTDDQGMFKVMIGNEKLMQRFECSLSEEAYKNIQKLEEEGKTVIQVAIHLDVVFVIALQEKHLSKPEAGAVCSYLRGHGYEIHMITGDHKHAALKIADALNINHNNVIYRAYPEDKKQRVQYLQSIGHRVMFIGDGVNDSPVLAQSDVGVAINSQSDITVEAADVVIIKNSLVSVIDTIRLTKASFKRIKINFFWAFIYNVILIPIAMGVLYPIIGFRLSPHLAALAMALSSISVVMSSLMLKLYKPYRY